MSQPPPQAEYAAPTLSPVLKVDVEVPPIPDPFPWTVSSLRLMRRCPRKFFWKYVLRLSHRTQSIPQLIGSFFHSTLDAWYSAGMPSMGSIVDRCFDRALEEARTARPEDDVESALLSTVGMLAAYAKHYRDDDRTALAGKSVRSEHKFDVSYGGIRMQGAIDVVLNKTSFFETKTASTIGETFIQRLPMDTQVRGYAWALSIQNFGKLRPMSATYNVVQKPRHVRSKTEQPSQYVARVCKEMLATPAKYFLRTPLTVSIEDQVRFFWELDSANQRLAYFRKGGGTVWPWSDPRVWPIDDQECTSYFTLCPMFDLCAIGADRGTLVPFEQREELHEELADK